MKVTIRVYPGARRAHVGGTHDDALVVKVTAPAVENKATRAALEAVAKAFGVRKRDVTLMTGARSRVKVVEVVGGDDRTLAALRAAE